MQLYQLTTPEQVDDFLHEFPTAAIFKAGTCHKTMQGFSVLETFLKQYDLPMGFIRVVESRPASNHVTDLSGITHHSPQFLLFKDGELKFDVDNWNITPQAVAPVFEQYVPVRPQERQEQSGEVKGNLEPYKQMLHAYLNGELSEGVFQSRWVNFFRDDASLRSKSEFETLSRLFGDPDAYHGGLHQLVPAGQRPDLRGAAQSLLEQLEKF